MSTAWKTAGAAVTGIAATLALVFSLWPQLLPDPRANLLATMEVQELESGVRYGQFLGRIHERTKGRNPLLVCEVGTIVYVKIGVEGRKHGDLSLEQWLYTSDGRRVPDQEDSAEDSNFKPDTPSDRWVQPVWISTETGYRDAHARLELYDGRTMLAMVETKPLPEPPKLKGFKLCPG